MSEYKYRIAAASTDGIVINQHFGRADRFSIYGIKENDETELIEVRSVTPVCHSGDHDDNELQNTARQLSDCAYVLVSRIGQGAAYALEAEGISPMELPGPIEESIAKLINYRKVQELLNF